MEFTKNIDEEPVEYPDEIDQPARSNAFEVVVQQLQRGVSVKLSPQPKRVGPRVEGISLTPEEFKKAKEERLEGLVRKEEKRRADEN